MTSIDDNKPISNVVTITISIITIFIIISIIIINIHYTHPILLYSERFYCCIYNNKSRNISKFDVFSLFILLCVPCMYFVGVSKLWDHFFFISFIYRFSNKQLFIHGNILTLYIGNHELGL